MVEADFFWRGQKPRWKFFLFLGGPYFFLPCFKILTAAFVFQEKVLKSNGSTVTESLSEREEWSKTQQITRCSDLQTNPPEAHRYAG